MTLIKLIWRVAYGLLKLATMLVVIYMILKNYPLESWAKYAFFAIIFALSDLEDVIAKKH